MTNETDDLANFLADVRQTINDNKQFIKRLADETVEDDSLLESEVKTAEEEYEEL